MHKQLLQFDRRYLRSKCYRYAYRRTIKIVIVKIKSLQKVINKKTLHKSSVKGEYTLRMKNIEFQQPE